MKQELQKRMVEETGMGEADEKITALGAMLQELYAANGHVGWLRRQIADMSQVDIGTIEGQALVNLYNNERDRKVRIAKLAIEAGVDQARVIVMEKQVMLLGEALARAADTAGLSAPMRKRLGGALRSELAGVEVATSS